MVITGTAWSLVNTRAFIFSLEIIMSKIRIILSALILFSGALVATPAHGADQADCAGMVYAETFPKAKDQVIICHKSFVVGYSSTFKGPLWSAEVLTADDLSIEPAERDAGFKADPDYPKDKQSSEKAYVGTGYDRGHLTNFADVADDPIAADQSFYMTNIVPQRAGNNHGIWKSLEDRVRKIAVREGKVYIVTGAVYDGKVVALPDGTAIPTRLFKLVYAPGSGRSYALIIPNYEGLPSSTLVAYFISLKNLKLILGDLNVMPKLPTKYTDAVAFE